MSEQEAHELLVFSLLHMAHALACAFVGDETGRKLHTAVARLAVDAITRESTAET